MIDNISTGIESSPMTKEALQRAIIDILVLNDQTYGDLQYNMGIRYLEAYLKDNEVRDVLAQSKVFWEWWVKHWTVRDADFLQMLGNVKATTVREKQGWYREYNDGHAMATVIRPHSVVLLDSFEDMFNEAMSAQ